jgi:hypothetical protein
MEASDWDGDVSAEVRVLQAQRPEIQQISIISDPARPLVVKGLSLAVKYLYLIPVEVPGLDGLIDVYLLGAKQA